MIPKFTPEAQKENLKKGIEALRSNPLKAVANMKNELGGKCCLQVLSDTAVSICGFDQEDYFLAENSYGTFPKAELGEVFGLPNTPNMQVLFDFPLNGETASFINDAEEGKKYPHSVIADLIEKEYMQ